MSPMIKAPLALEHALLGFVRHGPTHAYEIYRQLQAASALGLVWRIKQSQLYALLARLEEAGYLVASTETQETRPPRRMLHLTPEGESALVQWLQSPVRNGRDFRQELLAKLYFAQAEGPAVVAALLSAQHSSCQVLLDGFQHHLASVPDDRPFERLVYQFRAGQMGACLEWLDACAESLVGAD